MDYTKLQNGSDIRGVAMEGIEGPACKPHRAGLPRYRPGALPCGCARGWARTRCAWPWAATRACPGRSWRCGSWRQWPPRACRSRTSAWPRPRPMFMSTVTEGFAFDASVMITASHLPFNRNGYKFFHQGRRSGEAGHRRDPRAGRRQRAYRPPRRQHRDRQLHGHLRRAAAQKGAGCRRL